MATCKDCIHERVCFALIKSGLPYLDDKFPAEAFCMTFKDKSRYIELPCKVGDTVYKVMTDKRIKQPYKYKVIGFWHSADETCNNAHLVRYVNDVFESSMSVPLSDFGKTVFLTYEEAEEVLERSNNGEK